MATITWEWIVMLTPQGQHKFKGICRSGVPLHLWTTFDGGNPATASNYLYGLLRFYSWLELMMSVSETLHGGVFMSFDRR